MIKDITDYRLDMEDAFNVVAPQERKAPTQEEKQSAPPASAENKPVSPRITLRLSEEEDELLRQRASGLTISAYVRECLFGEHVSKRRRKSYAPVKDQIALAQLLALLGESRLANNLNQLAYQANTGNLDVDEHVEAQLDEMYDHVVSMRETLIRTLGLLEQG